MQTLPVLQPICCGSEAFPLPKPAAAELADRFRALADPTRVAIDISERRPKGLSREDVEWADLVVTMGCGDACPVISGKEYLDWNLADPVGMCLEEVRELRSVIEQRVAAV